MCAYAALLLADSEVEVTADNLNSCISAAGGSVPGYYTALFEKVNGMTSFADLVENAGNVGGGGGGGGAAPAAAAKGGAAAAAPVERTIPAAPPDGEQATADDDVAALPEGGGKVDGSAVGAQRRAIV